MHMLQILVRKLSLGMQWFQLNGITVHIARATCCSRLFHSTSFPESLPLYKFHTARCLSVGTFNLLAFEYKNKLLI